MMKYKLGDIAKTGSGGTPKSTVAEYYENGNIPWINSGELNNPFISSTSNFITQKGYDNSSAKLFPPQTILLAMYGATAGKASLLEFEACTNQAICAIMPNQDILLPRFLKYKLDTMYNYLVGLSTGSARDNLSQDGIKALELCIPPLSEQKKIVSVLSALDDKIALNKKMNQKLEAMAKRLYDYWFVQYDFPDKNGRPYKTSGGPMTYNQTLKREIPAGWEVATLANFAEYVKTTTKFDKAFNYVSTDNMLAEKQGLSGENLKPASGNVLCYEKGDILISNIRPYFKKIWYADQSGTCSTDVLCIRSLKSDNSYFVYKTLWQDDFFDYVMQGAKGSKMPRGDKTRIMNYPICIAKENFDELIIKFSALVVPMQTVIQKNTKEITRLTTLRDKLLPLLMNGQVEVE